MGNNYYRLQAIDFDGKSTMSKTESIEIQNSKNAISFYPNPTTTLLYVTNRNKISSLELFDISGRKLKYYARAQESIDVGMCANGVYILKAILTNGEIVEEKIVIKK